MVGCPNKGHFRHMAQFQPEIMVVDGLHQDGTHTGAATTQGVGIDLVAHQYSLLCRHRKPGKASFDTVGEGLFGMGNAVQAVGLAEPGHTGIFAIGNNTHRNSTIFKAFHKGLCSFISLRGVRFNQCIINIKQKMIMICVFLKVAIVI